VSGIAGLVHLDGAPAELAELGRMILLLAHRGPDGAAARVSGSAGLAHCQLRTAPESSSERLPLASPDGSLVLTADARLDNRTELAAALGCQPAAPDAELLLAAYRRWGPQAAEHLLGDFAFAIWDQRHQRLFCARDHLGIKPFYYHHEPGRLFCFASEIKALLALPQVPAQLNEIRVADYLLPMLEDPAITFYHAIQRLPPAHHMTVTHQGIRLQRYWALDPEHEIRLRSDREYAEAFSSLFVEAVSCRLPSACSVGTLLSGGLDSSSITCVARRVMSARNIGRGTLHTFSIVFPSVPEADEQSYIEAVTAGGELAPHYLRGDQLSPLGEVAAMLSAEDEPFYAPNLYLHWALYRAARQAGVRVLLDGIDGDTTVSHSLLYLAELARSARLGALIGETRALARHLGRPAWRLMWAWGLKPLAPQAFRFAWHAVCGRAGRISDLNPVLREEFVNRPEVADHLHAWLDHRRRPPKDAREDHWRRLGSGLVPFVLEVADRAAACWGIEPRYPFFDRRLVEFCLALPAGQKLRRGWTRFILRTAMEGILPPAIQWRGGKSDLTPAFLGALLTKDRRLLEDLPCHAARTLHPYVNPDVLKRTCEAALASGSEKAVFRIWPALTLSLWLGRAEPGPSPVHLSPTLEEALHMPQDTPRTDPPALEKREPKQPYAKPQLAVHGSIEQLTTNIGTKGADGLTGSKLA